jgi:hypothetical protein
MRVQQEGIKVFGFGEKKTPQAFMAACSQFIFTEKLMDSSSRTPDESIQKRKTTKDLKTDKWLLNLLKNAQNQTMDEYGWSNLADMGTYISNNSSFSPVNYGFKKLSNLLRSMDIFDIYMDEESKQMSVRDKGYKV